MNGNMHLTGFLQWSVIKWENCSSDLELQPFSQTDGELFGNESNKTSYFRPKVVVAAASSFMMVVQFGVRFQLLPADEAIGPVFNSGAFSTCIARGHSRDIAINISDNRALDI